MRKDQKKNAISYYNVFLIFLCGSVAGFILEGIFCLIKKGHWESHVVSVFAPYNILYGLGAVLFYIGAAKMESKRMIVKVTVMTALATVLELFCGLLLRRVLGMRAWNYSNAFLNYKGIICLPFTLAWGLASFGFCVLYPYISRAVCKCRFKAFKVICLILTVFIAVDFCLTSACLIRWSNRHFNFEAKNKIQMAIDKAAPDEWMQNRFVEWRFLDK